MRKSTERLLASGILEEKGLEFVREGVNGSNHKVILRDAYGELNVRVNDLLRGSSPGIQTAVNREEYIRNRLKAVLEELGLEFVRLGSNPKVIVKDKYGTLNVGMYDLLNGHPPNIKTVVNREEYTRNRLKDVLEEKDLEFVRLDNYPKVVVKDAYGTLSTTIHGLLRDQPPTIQSAVNKDEYVINRFTEVHGSTYDYTKFVYKGQNTKGEIVCKIHGSFWQTPSHHLSRRGCPKCADVIRAQHYFKDTPTTLYVVQFTDNIIKVGITTKTTKQRFRVETIKPKVLHEVHFENGLDAFVLEQLILQETKDHKVPYNVSKGILYKDGGITELRTVDALPTIRKYIDM